MTAEYFLQLTKRCPKCLPLAATGEARKAQYLPRGSTVVFLRYGETNRHEIGSATDIATVNRKVLWRPPTRFDSQCLKCDEKGTKK